MFVSLSLLQKPKTSLSTTTTTATSGKQTRSVTATSKKPTPKKQQQQQSHSKKNGKDILMLYLFINLKFAHVLPASCWIIGPHMDHVSDISLKQVKTHEIYHLEITKTVLIPIITKLNSPKDKGGKDEEI